MSNNINLYLSDRERTLLDACTVGIAGAGGLGSNCAAHLVRAGVRRLVIADFDVVMPGNLNRQFFFADQIGRKKINALRDNLLRIEPELELTLCDTKITPENAGSIFAGCGIVVEAFDHGREKMMLIETMLAAGKTVVAASGLAGWGRSGQIALRRTAAGRLYLVGDLDRAAGDGRNLFPASPRVGIAAAIEANTVIALILGEEP